MTSSPLRVDVLGIGLLGPGLADWAGSQAALRDPATAWSPSPTAIPAPGRLPPAERRRAGAIVKLGLGVADQAVAQAGLDAAALAGLATVFTASSGDGANCHAMLEVLASPERLVSPTRFTNSVHNAAAGYWHIATASGAPSTSLGAHDEGFAGGLLEAAVQCVAAGRPVLLVAGDVPYPEPLNGARPLPDAFGVALLLAPAGSARALASLAIAPAPGGIDVAACADPRLEALRRAIPAARALPLLQALATGVPRPARCVVAWQDGLPLAIDLIPPAVSALDRAGIAARIPHQGAMCLLDRLETWDRDGLHCTTATHRDPANPLRTPAGLLAPTAIEYAAQAMALHGALVAPPDEGARPGYLASVRGVEFHGLRLDALPAPLDVRAQRLAGDDRQILYRFTVGDPAAPFAQGRATVVLNTPLPTPP